MPIQIFPLPVKATLSDEFSMPSRIVQFGDGYTQRSADGLNRPNEIWSVECAFASETAGANLQAFLVEHGNWKSFVWKSPRDTIYQSYVIVGAVSGAVRRGGGSKPYFYTRTLKVKATHETILFVPNTYPVSTTFINSYQPSTYPLSTTFINSYQPPSQPDSTIIGTGTLSTHLKCLNTSGNTFSDVTGKIWSTSFGSPANDNVNQVNGLPTISLGSGGGIVTPNSADFDFGTGDYTIYLDLLFPAAQSGGYTDILSTRASPSRSEERRVGKEC